MNWYRMLSMLVALAVASVGAPPSGDACSLEVPTFHACCQPTATTPEAPSCCAEDSEHHPGQRSTGGIGCQCEHGANVPTVIVDTSSGQPGQTWLGTRAAEPATELTAPGRTDTVSSGDADRHRPPPLYLLDCAFLI